MTAVMVRVRERALEEGDVAPLLATDTKEEAANLARSLDAARRRGAYPLLLLLERLLVDAGRIGTAATVEEEQIRIRHDPQLAFRPGEVTALRVVDRRGGGGGGAARPIVEIVTSFLGLSGAVSPLPPYVSEEIAQEDEEAPRRREFLDLFHHRFVSLFFRARARADYPNTYRSDQSDPWSERVLSLVGREGPSRIERWRLLRWAPLLAGRNITVASLEAALADALADAVGEVGVSIETFVGGWADIDPSEHNRLGVAGSTLGQNLVVGRRILDRAAKFRIVVGPLSGEMLARLTADKAVLRRVSEMVADLCGGSLEHEIVLWLSKEAAPHLELGTARLGRDAWLGGQVRETRLRIEAPAEYGEKEHARCS